MNRNPRPDAAVSSLPAGTLDWLEDAACGGTGLDLFFGPDDESPSGRDDREADALAVCARCPVRVPCLMWQLRFPSQEGVAGGMTEDDRRVARHWLLRCYPGGEFPAHAVAKALAAKSRLKVCAGPCGRRLAAREFPRRGDGRRRTACKDCYAGMCREQQRAVRAARDNAEARVALEDLEIAS